MTEPRCTVRIETLQEAGGLVWAYRLGEGTRISLEEARGSEEPVWLHLNLSDSRARLWLTEHADLPAAALALILEPQPRIRLAASPGARFGLLEDLYHDFHGDPEEFGEFRFYVDGRRVISVRRHPLRSVDLMRRDMEAGTRFSSTDAWLEHFIETMAHTFGSAVDDLVERVDALEDAIVGGSIGDERAALSQIRRLLVRLRRHLAANRAALLLLRGEAAHDAGQAPTPMRHALDHLDGVSSDLDLVHERVRLLQEEVAGLLAESTHRNLYVLSIVTTALLPATLVTGFWGMNVGGLPWHDSDHGALWTGLTVAASILLSLGLLRLSKAV